MDRIEVRENMHAEMGPFYARGMSYAARVRLRGLSPTERRVLEHRWSEYRELDLPEPKHPKAATAACGRNPGALLTQAGLNARTAAKQR